MGLFLLRMDTRLPQSPTLLAKWKSPGLHGQARKAPSPALLHVFLDSPKLQENSMVYQCHVHQKTSTEFEENSLVSV